MMSMEASDVVAIGDNEVDVELLHAAGFGVIVSDSSEELNWVADL
jgi:hydroxymethylpyrimidine pyrophosphatase-like HAD family hydrolase